MMDARNLLPFLYQWHRRLGILIAFPVILWTLSGVLHPVMSRLNPEPVTQKPMMPGMLTMDEREPAEVLKQNGIESLKALRVVSLDGETYYQASTAQGVRYVNATSGKELSGGDELFARRIAAHYTGRPDSDIVGLKLVTSFDREYLWINRLLPVWRVDYVGGDHLSVFVETAPARLASMVDDRKRITTGVFNALHTWRLIPEGIAKTVVMSILLVVSTGVALGGLVIYGVLRQRGVLERRKETGTRRWHRLIGVSVSVFAGLFAFSGLYHLLHEGSKPIATVSGQTEWSASRVAGQLPHALFGHMPTRVVLACGTEVCSLALPRAAKSGEHDHGAGRALVQQYFELIPVSAGSAGISIREQAETMARLAAGIGPEASVEEFTTITRFEGEYGFLNKRLPVLKVRFASPGHPAVYWEPSTGVVAALVNDDDRLEGYSFANLHKYHWLDFAGKNFRDGVMALAALMTALVTVLGMVLWIRRKR